MCSGNNANPYYALNQQLDERARREKRQEKRQAELDAIAERRTAKEEAMDAEMKTMRQDARVDRREARQDARAAQGVQQYSSPAPAPSVAVESTQAVPGGNSGNQAPTAALSGRKGRRAKARGSSSSLRIDPAGSGAGVGPNIAV